MGQNFHNCLQSGPKWLTHPTPQPDCKISVFFTPRLIRLLKEVPKYLFCFRMALPLEKAIIILEKGSMNIQG